MTPILDQVARGVGTIVAMPNELVLRHLPDSALEARGNDLACQFLERVQTMHQQNIAHLDLKLDDIVVTDTTQPQWLLIIGFSSSVWIPEQESRIEGYRGTEG
jgi:serine/threonine protein kinase